MGIGISSIRKCGCAGDYVINIDDNNVDDDTQCHICLDLIKSGPVISAILFCGLLMWI